LPIDINTAWNFFSDPRNLEKITPPWLGFRILSNLPDKMFPGMLVAYKVKPLLGFPVTWVTQINVIHEKSFFIDEQKFGPYKLWHHKHTFIEKDGGVEMIDEVTYSPGFGFLSGIINKMVVSKKIEEIFAFRKDVLNKLF
jgi:ligand-binding SRPBCC domain-containing protein